MGSHFPNNNRELFLHQIKWLVAFMAIGFAIIWLFTFPVDLVLLMIVFVLMSVYNSRIMLKRVGLLDTSHVKGVKGFFQVIISITRFIFYVWWPQRQQLTSRILLYGLWK
jgi:4-hydroxybenzoate polyprenyltransferase